MRRRSFLIAGSSTCMTPLVTAANDFPGAASDIVLGQSVDLKGPTRDIAHAFNDGALLAIAEANSRGGIQGRRLRLVTLGDDGVAEKAHANGISLINDHRALAFFGCSGSSTLLALEPLMRDTGALSWGAFGMVDSVRQKCRGVAYFMRAPFAREIDQLVQHLTTIGVSRIGFVGMPQGGEEILKLLSDSLAGRKLEVAISTTLSPDSSNLADAARRLMTLQPQAVIMFLPGHQAAELMEEARRIGQHLSFYGLSCVSGDAVMQRLGDKARGLVIVQSVPYPWSQTDLVISEYRRLCEQTQHPVTYPGLEGFMSLRVLVEALRRCGPEITRSRLNAAFKTLQMRLGTLDIDFVAGGQNGARFVELVQIARNGRYVH